MSIQTISPSEAAHFGALASDWWDPSGRSAMLHKLNPVRLRYCREQIDAHFGSQAKELKPLRGKRVLDVGCGAGLLAEPMARLGGNITGVDAASENIDEARRHAQGQGLDIAYHAGEVADISGVFDLVTAMEVIEHVTDPAVFVAALAARLASGGLMILSTPNRTTLSRFGLVTLAEQLGQIPKGTHDWHQFITPEELSDLLTGAGLKIVDRRGISFSPFRGLILSDDLTLNYLIAATAA